MRSEIDSSIAQPVNSCQPELNERVIAIHHLHVLPALNSPPAGSVQSSTLGHCVSKRQWS